MLHTITKRLEICIDINIKISEVDYYTWICTNRIFRLPLEISIFLFNELLSQSRKLNNCWGIVIKAGRGGNFLFQNKTSIIPLHFFLRMPLVLDIPLLSVFLTKPLNGESNVFCLKKQLQSWS